MPLTSGEIAFAYAMQHERTKRSTEQRLLELEKAKREAEQRLLKLEQTLTELLKGI